MQLNQVLNFDQATMRFNKRLARLKISYIGTY